MELGTRWDVGDEPPSDLPDEVLRAIDRVEAELETDGVDVVGWRWTLTWLERRPRVELDDGTTIRVDPDGSAIIVAPRDED